MRHAEGALLGSNGVSRHFLLCKIDDKRGFGIEAE
jgi:hypothetical protein